MKGEQKASGVRRLLESRSLGMKFGVFSALLVIWLAAAQLAFHLIEKQFSIGEHIWSSLMLVLCAVFVAWLTTRVFVRPLEVLENAMTQVREGRLEPVRVSETGDEIERLGKSFNRMIAALAASQEKVQEYQEQLEQKIRERTKALEEAMRWAEAANKAKDAFLANVSHELRTPMNGILGMLDIALDGPLGADAREDLQTARECSLSLLALLNDILDLSKVEAGKLSLEKVSFSLATVIDVCRRFVLPKAKQKGLRLRVEVSPDVPDRLTGDPLRLRQILMNLLGNAVKFTESGYVTLRVSRSPAKCPGAVTLQFDVIDTGVGIPQDKLEAIFDKFTQADGSTTRKYGGTGLGLAITRMLATLHGGEIWVESELGRGSTFHVTIELAEAQAPDEPAEGSARFRGETDTSCGRPAGIGRILVVEDNLVNQKVLAGLLGRKGYKTTLANHGQEALQALVESAFDLVLMDIQMPVMDGLETTRLIRHEARWREMPIIGLTAHAMNRDRERCLEAGMNDYLPKPVRAAVLLAAVEKCLSAATAGGIERSPNR